MMEDILRPAAADSDSEIDVDEDSETESADLSEQSHQETPAAQITKLHNRQFSMGHIASPRKPSSPNVRSPDANILGPLGTSPTTASAFKRLGNAAFQDLSLRLSDASSAGSSDSQPQLNLLPLMQQWSLAAARHAALLNQAGPYFPYGLISPTQQPSLMTPNGLIHSMNHSTFGHPGINQSALGMPSRRPMNPFKAPPIKKYKCEECGKAFSRSNTLVTHKRIHTGEKPFKCDSCGRAFRQPGNLTRHKLTHTTVKPYVCPTCGKAFNRASNLHTHMRTHANFRPFICHLCGKSFQQKIDLKVHFYTHTGLFPPTQAV